NALSDCRKQCWRSIKSGSRPLIEDLRRLLSDREAVIDRRCVHALFSSLSASPNDPQPRDLTWPLVLELAPTLASVIADKLCSIARSGSDDSSPDVEWVHSPL